MKVLINGEQYEATRATNDINGNPRYIVHFLAFLNKEESFNYDISINDKISIALNRVSKIGGKKNRGKDYGGGIVFQSYNLQADMDKLVF